ncbi:MAG: benzaldehyde dehydrogenase [Pseudomonas sp.]|jgi:benzaldehyde dehydrogenase (NAD)|uniref:Aldehyde dehydrogenase family protein n=1 Tax=Pseudomonas neustonica TaxID=2487346 RepID=A0ABX9XER7_9PSED|nr:MULTISPECIES: benzaldehyde dehydrogenase [Pseudomonas]MBA6421030.1 benzaldehyde dehydrogenase [Pseudomonas sp. 5Ae-yellow]MBL4834944.1 benzaldehyde dehydrogenase [Pseudomonas sp.]ROZ80957.1 aldehyde dehydrogenase family protein [Pseudomonas sp. SSM44]ROZ82155.1 aldehyde dehydrogenase family protein [Pseudomonas neustonica]|tara:strand:+ start:24099 stop:25559 length:1461 start_codon:yes stop_codon:yes gene_type:complete
MDRSVTPVWEKNLFLGAWQLGEGEQVAVTEPATGEVISHLMTATPADVDRAATFAQATQQQWMNVPFDQKAEILRKAAALLKERAEEINGWNTRECGSIAPKAAFELQSTYEQAQMAAALPMQANGKIFPSTTPGKRNYWTRVPLGTVGVIAPWNFPILLAMRSVFPALAMGNCVILKPDLKSAICGGALMAQILEDAGLPAGVFHVLPGGPEVGEALVEHPLVKMISFTGSTAVGRKIGETCGRMLKKVALELGGNNAQIVLGDADLDIASSCGAWGSFLHQGQICMQTGRHLVHQDVAHEYIERLAARARNLVCGDPHQEQVHLGPLINDTQARRVEDLINRSLEMGARLVAGGKRNGSFFEATVIADVTPDMPVFAEEVFGPVAPVMVFNSDADACSLVNQSPYGLAAAIHSGSTERALKIAGQLKVGMIHINDQTVNNEFQVPFGGMGSSGNSGRFGGPANIEEFTTSQWVSVMAEGIQYPF